MREPCGFMSQRCERRGRARAEATSSTTPAAQIRRHPARPAGARSRVRVQKSPREHCLTRKIPYASELGIFWAGAGNRIVRTGNFSRGSGKPDFGGDARRRLKALSRELTGLSTEGVAALVPWNWSAHRARLRQERLVRMKISHARLRPYGGPPITRGNTGSRLMEKDFDRESWVKVLYSIPRCQAGLV